MKLHQIRLENINSLYGEQSLDLDVDLRGAACFLVVGPTGAGKSTLLDAVSLALFGSTPRLPKARATPEQYPAPDDPRRVMSWGTAHCLAEVVFSRRDGMDRRRYRARWSCNRANNRPDGKLKAPERSLERLNTIDDAWELVSGGKRIIDYQEGFGEALGGMRREEFERRILLAQGRFADFVKADSKDQAALLERLTGAGKYTKIGEAVRKQHSESVSLYNRAVAVAGTVEVLDQSARARLELKIQERKEELEGVQKQERLARAGTTWILAAAKLNAKLIEVETSVARHIVEEDEADQDLKRLEAHLRCANARDKARRASTERRDRATLRARVEGSEAALEKLERSHDGAQKAMAARQGELDRARAEVEVLRPVLARARALRQRSDDATRELKAAQQSRIDNAARLTSAAERLVDETKTLSEAKEMVERAAGACKEAAIGERLEPALSGLQTLDQAWRRAGEMAQSQLKKTANALSEAEVRQKTARTRRDQAKPPRERAEAAWATVSAKANALAGGAEGNVSPAQAKKRAAQLLKNLESEERRLHKALALADERDALREGEPCPICGSKDHPHADDEAARSRDAELRDQVAISRREIEALKESREELDRAEEAARDAQDKANSENAEATKAEHEAKSAQERAETAAKHATQADMAARQARSELLAILPDLAEDAPSETLKAAVVQAAAQVSAWRKARLDQQKAAQILAKAEPRFAKAAAAHEGAERSLGEASERLLEREKIQARSQRELAEILKNEALEGRDPDQADRESVSSAQAADKLLQGATATARAAAGTLQEHKGKHRQLCDELKRRDGVVAEVEGSLAKALSELEIDLEGLQARTLSAKEEETIAKKKRSLQERRTQLDALLAERQRSRDVHAEERPAGAPAVPTHADAEIAQEALKALEERRQVLTTELAEERAALAQDERQRAQRLRFDQAVKEAKEREHLWGRLNGLIGRRKGQAFRDFAMTLTLQQLVEIANVHLRTLSERYILTVDRDSNGRALMGFAMLDCWQADRRRSMSNLSGGETFLVSLALALGLAGLSTASISVETLLLDEGFGMLDNDTLEIAMDALGKLKDSVQVGIISHVEALKTHVPAQVIIEASGEGRSILRIGGES